MSNIPFEKEKFLEATFKSNILKKVKYIMLIKLKTLRSLTIKPEINDYL